MHRGLRFLKGAGRPGRGTGKPRKNVLGLSSYHRRLAVEPLEQRTLLSVAASSAATQQQTLADLPVAAQQAVSSAIGQDQSAYHASIGAAGVSLGQPGQRLHRQLQSGALQISAGLDTWDMSLMGLGYDGAVQPVGTAQTSVNGNRVDCNYGTIDEWYINSPGGLEQGFNMRPAAAVRRRGAADGGVGLGRRYDGAVNAAGNGLTLFRPDGSAALKYTGLLAYDAAGMALPATLEVQTDGDRQELLIHVNAAGAQGAITIDPELQEAELSSTSPYYDFGSSVAISGNTLVVAAPGTFSGVNYTGAAYVFTASGANWSQAAMLTVFDGTGPLFGSSVSINESGNTVVVGAEGSGTSSDSNYGPGAAYVFTEPGAGWASTSSPTATLTASDGAAGDNFGASVSISGNTVVVGAEDAAIGGNSDAGGGLRVHGAQRRLGQRPTMTEAAKLTSSDGTGTTISAARFRSAATRWRSERKSCGRRQHQPGGGVPVHGARRRLVQRPTDDPDRQAHRVRWRRGTTISAARFRSAATRWWSERAPVGSTAARGRPTCSRSPAPVGRATR